MFFVNICPVVESEFLSLALLTVLGTTAVSNPAINLNGSILKIIK